MEDTNTDEVLDPVDNILYKAVTYVRDDNPSLSDGTLGKIAYFLRRALSRNPGTNRFKTIGHLECLVLLLDDLADKVSGEIASISVLGEILTVMSSIKVKVNTPTSGKIMYDSVNYTEQVLSGPELNSQAFDSLYLAVCYLVAAKNRNNKYWHAQALMHIERILPVIDDQRELTTEQLFQKLTMFTLLNIYDPSQYYRAEIEQLIAILSLMEMPPTLLNGRGTLVIAELALANPGLINCWEEVMFVNIK